MPHTETITLTLQVPDGYELTGEFRWPEVGEWFLTDSDTASQCQSGISGRYPILRPKPPEKRKGWVNVYSLDVPDYLHRTKEAADAAASVRGGRLACVPVEYQVPH